MTDKAEFKAELTPEVAARLGKSRDEARESINPEPTTAMIDAGVAFALNVSLSGEYTWSQYVKDLYMHMNKHREDYLKWVTYLPAAQNDEVSHSKKREVDI